MAHAHCMPVNKGYRYTFRTCNMYYLSTVTWLHYVPQCCVICTVPVFFSYFLNAAGFLCTVSCSRIFVKVNGCIWLILRYCRLISKNDCRKLLNISSHTAEWLPGTGTRISEALKLHWFSYTSRGASLSQKKPAITASSSKSFVWMQTQLSVFCFSCLTHRHILKLQLRPWKRMTLVRTYFHLFHHIRCGFGSVKCPVLRAEGAGKAQSVSDYAACSAT